jgi:hypothetical protein
MKTRHITLLKDRLFDIIYGKICRDWMQVIEEDM